MLKLPSTELAYPAFTIDENLELPPISFPSQRMLGKQAEYLFEHYLTHSKRYQIIASNIQIQGIFETLGELDYIVLDTLTNKKLHIELACKFYLLDESLGSEIKAQWIGPNRKDRLIDKLEKLHKKQFPLLHKKETSLFLDTFEINSTKIEQQVCLKAFLFLPKNKREFNIPQHYAHCIVGTYIKFEELDTIIDANASYALPSKKEWLLPPISIENWFSFSEVKEKITESIAKKRSPLVYKKVRTSIEKIFVVWW